MPTKRRVLELLTRPELQAVVDRYDLAVDDRRVKDQLVDAAASSRKVPLAEVLADFARDRLKDLCRELGLDDGGREKASLVERLVGGNAGADGGAVPRTNAHDQLPLPLAAGGVTIATPAPAPKAPMHENAAPPPSTNGRTFTGFREIASFIWENAERLRGAYKPHEYGKVILPLTVLRRLDCVLADTKVKVLAKYESLSGDFKKNPDPILNRITGVPFHNISKLDFAKLKGDPNHIAQNLTAYIKGFSSSARDAIEQFHFADHIVRLDEANLLFQVVSLFADVDLHPSKVPNHVMGSIFEELIRRFSEQSNEEAGEHYTPREVIRLMVDLLFADDDEALREPGVVRTLYDPACGTGVLA